MNFREQAEERKRGMDWFRALSGTAKWLLADQMRRGDFEWELWDFEKAPSSAFRAGVDAALKVWEKT